MYESNNFEKNHLYAGSWSEKAGGSCVGGSCVGGSCVGGRRLRIAEVAGSRSEVAGRRKQTGAKICRTELKRVESRQLKYAN